MTSDTANPTMAVATDGATSSLHQLTALGFCGADDSVHPHHLIVLSQAFPLVEFGVLFRPDLEGQPRYATSGWVERLSRAVHTGRRAGIHPIKLAAHLCGSRVNELLRGDTAFLTQLLKWGFQRVQINATAVNGVDTDRLDLAVPRLMQTLQAFPQLDFILQRNEETRPLWQGILDSTDQPLPANLCMLVDESKGTGVASDSWPEATGEFRIGYAGGIGPGNIGTVLKAVQTAANGHPFWIDMESSLRSIKNTKDIFDVETCYDVIEAVCDLGFMSRPNYLPTSEE